MHARFLLVTLCLIMMVLSACALMPQYTALETELEDTRIQKARTDKKLRDLEIELAQAEARIQRSEEKRNKDLADLQAQCNYLKKINQQLSENIKTLERELNKKESVIELQEQVIQLLDDTKKTIETSLKDQIAAQQIEVVEVEDKLKVIFVDKILFDSASADINPKGKELLLIMAGSLKDNKNQNIVVEGHTDNKSLRWAFKKRFPSNWELSTARASAVVRFFQEHGGIKPQRLSARGYSFYRPVASNETEKGRRQNRRIEIILAPFR